MAAIDVSKTLGEYMLKGWNLTSDTCPKENCSAPLMRSPKGQTPSITFCANCDEAPNGPPPSEPSSHSPNSYATMSRSSTPLTDISSGLSSPTFALPVETAESLRRRQQSDAASEEIGKRLLKGWAMLADECPNTRCFGVPLVRPPLASGKDPRKECVACGTVYVDEKDASDWEHLVAVPEPQGGASGLGSSAATLRSDPLKVNKSSDTPNALGLKPLSTKGEQPSAPQESYEALVISLRALSQKLSSLSNDASKVDHEAIGGTADAMSKVLDAIFRAKTAIAAEKEKEEEDEESF